VLPVRTPRFITWRYPIVTDICWRLGMGTPTTLLITL
jgi:hypothetical protein